MARRSSSGCRYQSAFKFASQWALLVIEVKSLAEAPERDNAKAFEAEAQKADLQVRSRIAIAYGASMHADPPPRLLLVAWVGLLFRPYLWDSTIVNGEDDGGSTDSSSSYNEQAQACGTIRPSNEGVRICETRLDSREAAVHAGLFWSLATAEGKQVFQQVFADVQRIRAGQGAAYPELYGDPGYGETQRRVVKGTDPGYSEPPTLESSADTAGLVR